MPKKQKTPPSIPTRRASRFLDLLQFQFHLISRLSERQAEEQVRHLFGLRLRETRIIGMVGSYGALPVRILSTHGHFEKGHASRLVAALVRKGLIRNELDPDDQRANILRLSPEGEGFYRDIYTLASQNNDRWLAALPKEQHEALRQALATLLQLAHDAEPEEAGKRARSTVARRPKAARRNPKP